MSTRFFGSFALVAGLALASCATSHPTTPDVPPPVPVDVATVQRLDSLTLQNWLPANLGGLELTSLGLPPYLVPAPAGSSPKQRRQWQKAQAQNLARAGVQPTTVKIKNSSVATAPGATAINRPASPVASAAGSVATDARKAGQRGGGGVATARAAVATGAQVQHAGLPWWLWVLFGIGCGLAGWRLAYKYGG